MKRVLGSRGAAVTTSCVLLACAGACGGGGGKGGPKDAVAGDATTKADGAIAEGVSDGATGAEVAGPTLSGVFQLTKLDIGKYPEARCPDGSPAAYYYSPGGGNGAKKWSIHLDLAGTCMTVEDCKAGKDGETTSKNLKPEKQYDGVFNRDPSLNPGAWDWHMLSIFGCSRDRAVGDTAPTAATLDQYFRGYAIVRDVMKELESQGLGDAQQILLHGSSGGGRAVTNSVDFVQQRYPQADVRGFSDSAWDGDPMFFGQAEVDIQIGTIKTNWTAINSRRDNVECLAERAAQNESADLCYLDYDFVTTVDAPLFLRRGLLDEAAVKEYMERNPELTEAEAQTLVADWILGGFSTARVKSGDAIFLPNTESHFAVLESAFYTEKIGLDSTASLLADWLSDKTRDYRLVQTATSPTECGGLVVPTYPGKDFDHKVVAVNPKTIDAAVQIDPNKDHLVGIPKHVTPNAKLFVFLTGSKGSPSANTQIIHMASYAGFTAVSLAYPNAPLADECENAVDNEQCEEDYRREVISGDDVSAEATVGRADSIEGRIVSLAKYFNQEKPGAGFDKYFSGSEPVWSNIVLTGHSQGGAYAGMISQAEKVGAVLHFSSFCDYFQTSPTEGHFADWCDDPRATGPEHRYDFINALEVSFANVEEITTLFEIDSFGPVTSVDSAAPPYACTHRLSTERMVAGAEPHGSLTGDDAILLDAAGTPVNAPAYMYLFAQLATAP
jgi:hypothetical protein